MSVPTIYAWDLFGVGTAPAPVDAADRAFDPGYDIAFDHATKKFRRGPDGDLVRTYGLEAVAQGCRIALLTFRGEWYTNTTIGTPWFTAILVKSPNLGAIRSIFRDRLLTVPGVLNVTALEVAFDRGTRKLTVTFSVSTDYGEIANRTVTLSIS